MSEADQSGGREDQVLTSEQQAMWRREHRADMQNKSKDEKLAVRNKLRQQLDAMSEAERTTLRNQLQAKWDALPADKKQKLREKISERHQATASHGNGKGGRKRRASAGNAGDE